MAEIFEKFDSRDRSENDDASTAELLYGVTGTEDDEEVKTLVEATLPATFRDLPLQGYTFKTVGGGVWEVTANYSSDDLDEPEDQYTFDTGGGTAHITQSIETVGTYPAPGEVPPDFQSAIGVNQDTIEGTDVTIPVYNFTETHKFDNAVVTSAYKATLFSLTGRVNNASFKGFAQGEVLFLGASGSKRGRDQWEITFRFAASPNVTGLALGPITGIAKKGWEYLWVRYTDDDDAAAHVLIKKPVAAYVERVYEFGNFAGIGIGT